MEARPLAAMMVADATPLTVASIRRLAEWTDVVLCEATATLGGDPRTPLRSEWHSVTGIDSDRLRVVTTNLVGDTNSARAHVQRNSVLPLLVMGDPARPVLTLDPDEILEPDTTLRYIRDHLGDQTLRLPLTPLYGAIDRIAPNIHCCWYEEQRGLRDPDRPRPEYLIGAAGLARAASAVSRNIDSIRFASPEAEPRESFGVHVTMAESADAVSWKLRNNRHVWDPRVSEPQHLNTMLAAGVHHAGWWIAIPYTPDASLLALAAEAGLRVAGAPQPTSHLRALRAWSELRLDPQLSDEFVRGGDDYAATRDPEAQDFLLGVDQWQLTREIVHTGHEIRDPADTHVEAGDG